MRYSLLFVFLLLIVCTSCGRYKKYVAATDVRFAQQADSIRMLQDSTLKMRLAVERAAGRNDGLLATQDKYLARLQEQSDQLDDLRGNLNSTSSQLTGQLTKLRQQLTANTAEKDSLFARQARLISAFQQSVETAAILMDTMLRDNVDNQAYTIATGAGTVTLSVQEELLFSSRNSNRLKDEASFVLRAVTETLRADPLLKVLVVGHTDNQPNPRRGTNNWAYAALRATTLADELTTTYYLSPNRIISASHGEYGPLTANDTPEGRTKNRRMDFVFRNNVGNLVRELEKLSVREEEEKED